MFKFCYDIMMVYMFKVGFLGFDMMYWILMIQVNFDFLFEVDMVKKMCVGLVLQLIVIVIFVNFFFIEGKLNGFKLFWVQIWIDMDVDWIGDMLFVFEEGFGFECYVEWVFDVLMYFVKCGDIYFDVIGMIFW